MPDFSLSREKSIPGYYGNKGQKKKKAMSYYVLWGLIIHLIKVIRSKENHMIHVFPLKKLSEFRKRSFEKINQSSLFINLHLIIIIILFIRGIIKCLLSIECIFVHSLLKTE